MSDKTILLTMGAILGVTGFCIIGYNSNWYIALGVFIMMGGNNLEQAERFIKK